MSGQSCPPLTNPDTTERALSWILPHPVSCEKDIGMQTVKKSSAKF